MDQLLSEPLSIVLAAVFGSLAVASLSRAAIVIGRSRPWPEATPMLRPIRAWRMLIFGAAMVLISLGFALQLGWLIAFGAIVAFVETLEASMMLQALGDAERELARKSGRAANAR
jgi:hypothetical protein